MKPKCRNCHCRPVNRPRGLCWGCWYKPEVRSRFPITSKFNPQKNADHGNRQNLPLGTPTSAWPGSEGKIAVMAFRAGSGLAIFHPRDAAPPLD